MGYEKLSDVQTVILGGVDKKTGKRNPTELEGYFLRVEQRPNKFNTDKPQNYYVFQTQNGEEGVFGKAGLDREMKKASPNAMTKVVHTGTTRDTGKGNPMVVFDVFQDKSNIIEQAYAQASVDHNSDEEDSYQETDVSEEDSYEPTAPTTTTAKVAPRALAKPADLSRQSKVKELLGRK